MALSLHSLPRLVTVADPAPPPADPCAALGAELAARRAVDADNLADARRIRGNSASTAGDPWKRLQANVAAAQRIIDRLEGVA